MSTLNISLPDEMISWIDEQVAKGGFSSASEYILELIRQDWHRKAEEDLEMKLLEGLDSQGERVLTEEVLQEIRDEAMKRINVRKKMEASPVDNFRKAEIR